MSKSTRFTQEDLDRLGLEETSPGVFAPVKKESFDGNKTDRHDLDERGIVPAINKEDKSIAVGIPHIGSDFMFAPSQGNHIGYPQIKLVVLGEPKAQKRHRHFTPKKANFTTTYDPSKADKKDFLSIVQDNAPEVPYDQPLHLDVVFYFGRPKSHFRTGKNAHIMKDNAPLWHTGRPDVDNLFKFCTDALTKIYWRDDSLICSTSITKKYDDNPRTEITITPL